MDVAPVPSAQGLLRLYEIGAGQEFFAFDIEKMKDVCYRKVSDTRATNTETGKTHDFMPFDVVTVEMFCMTVID